MNYLEIKVKELFEQVLRGEKRVPELRTEQTFESKRCETFKTDVLTFSENLLIKYYHKYNWLEVKIEDKVTVLFSKDFNELKESIINNIEIKRKPSEDRLELNRLFKEVWEYSKDIANDKWLIDKVFGEIK